MSIEDWIGLIGGGLVLAGVAYSLWWINKWIDTTLNDIFAIRKRQYLRQERREDAEWEKANGFPPGTMSSRRG